MGAREVPGKGEERRTVGGSGGRVAKRSWEGTPERHQAKLELNRKQ